MPVTREGAGLPGAPQDFDAEVVNGLLAPELRAGQRVVRVELEDMGAGHGFLGFVTRLHLEYSLPGALPDSMILKLPAQDAQVRERAHEGDLYRREVRFFTEIAPTVDVSVPRLWAARFDPATSAFVLLLEDIRPVQAIDQIRGCSLEQAVGTVRELAHLHAPWWASERVAALDWVPAFAGHTRVRNLVTIAERGWPRLLELGPEDDDERIVAVGERMLERLPLHLARLDELTPTLVHGDARLDNLLFRPGQQHPVIIDWQGISKGPGLLDVAYFLTQSLTVEDRRQHLGVLLEEYTAALGRSEAPFTAAEAREIFALAGYFSLCVACGVALFDTAQDPRAAQLARCMFVRSATAVLDAKSHSF